jgi:membrane associated rhomboid family serine protease
MMAAVPLSDASRRPTNFPIVTLTIIVACFVVFIMELVNGDAFVSKWSMVPANISAGKDYVTIITAMFMHASWSHIIGNMVFFWAFGPEVEDAMGSGRYAVFYLLGGILAMLGQYALDPHSTVSNLGASGAIAAVMGAFIVTYPQDEIRTILVIFVFVRTTFVSAALLIGLWFLTQLLSLGQIAQGQAGGVAYMAHVCGFTFGALFGRFFERLSPLRYFSSTRSAPE